MKKLYRSRSDRMITGLSGGLAEVFGIDSTWIRLLLVITAFFSGGVVIPLYFLAVIVIPKEPFAGGPFGPGYGFEGGHGQGGWNGDAAWQQWGKQWGGGKKRHCGSNKYQYGDRREYEAQYNPFEGQQGQGQAGTDFDDKMKDIEKKAMWREIEELRAKVASYEKNQQTKGEV
ncbi:MULTISPECIES: PspC domain-containing protein [Paenibacillus]|uniref:PspC domain-containing protein n=1 Tax=Paenibacillus radicis (ex Xue et al. 2023) TaxID=2972489 RepID=A0ABT1YML7_9BACL|nr:PspC domain-containing protein [Paenibacillus radicis (ex Xue et al. 2023)]MCR8633240.1 PspC domain-containing protein [Paenibacillus radicis (ex Xue et al. 2023)]